MKGYGPPLAATSGVLLALSLLPYLKKEAWWIRAWDFPRLQINTLSALVSLAALRLPMSRRWRAAIQALSLATGSLQSSYIFPYTRLFRHEVPPAKAPDSENTLSLLIANVFMPNRDAEGLVRQICRENPDVVLLLEPDRWWSAKLRGLKKLYPHGVRQCQSNTYGMILLSRFPLIRPTVHFIVKKEVPSIHTGVRLPSGRTIRLHAVHPEPPSPQESASSAPRDTELQLVGLQVRKENRPAIVAGDLNDVAWSRTTRLFKTTSRLMDPRRGRGLFNTYHAQNPLVRWPLDHVFHSRDFKLVQLKRLQPFGSDHFPILISLAYEPNRRASSTVTIAGHEKGASASARLPSSARSGRLLRRR